jgi:hypothetical protein
VLAALALAALQEDLTPLERHAREAELIVAGRVERILETSQGSPRSAARPSGPVPLAEVAVTRVLLGDPRLERVFVLAARPDGSDAAPLLEVGDAALLFLDPRDARRGASPRAWRIPGAPKGAQVYDVRADGAWLAEQEGLGVRPPRPGIALPPAVARGPSAGLGPLGMHELEAWVDRRLDELTPSLSVQLVSTGPAPWEARVAADGAWHVDRDWTRPAVAEAGPIDGVLAAAELAKARAVWDAERFRTHPAHLGSMIAPDDSWLILRMRTRGGVSRLDVHRSGGRAESEPVAAARAHVLAILAGLPGDPGLALRIAR